MTPATLSTTLLGIHINGALVLCKLAVRQGGYECVKSTAAALPEKGRQVHEHKTWLTVQTAHDPCQSTDSHTKGPDNFPGNRSCYSHEPRADGRIDLHPSSPNTSHSSFLERVPHLLLFAIAGPQAWIPGCVAAHLDYPGVLGQLEHFWDFKSVLHFIVYLVKTIMFKKNITQQFHISKFILKMGKDVMFKDFQCGSIYGSFTYRGK